MKDRILQEPSFCLGLLVWAAAATVFPLQLGTAGAGLLAFVGYVAIAGFLLAVADVLLNPALYRRPGDVLLQGVFWMIGLAVPAAVMFLIGTAAAPASEEFSDGLCQLGGLEGRVDPDDGSDTAIEDALESLDDCEGPA